MLGKYEGLKPTFKILLFLTFLFLFINIFQSYLPLEYVYLNFDLLLSSFLAAIIVNFIFEKELYSFGLNFDSFSFRNVIVISIITIILILLIIASKLTFSNISLSSNISSRGIFDIILIMLFISIFEEISFRGIIFQELRTKFSPTTAIISTSLAFALLHLGNFGFDFLAFINVFLAGLLLGFLVLKSSDLWSAISFHFIWNTCIALFAGSNLSGNNYDSILIYSNNESLSPLFYGGEYGIESGLITTIILIILLILSNKFIKISPYGEATYLRKLYKK